MVFAQFCYYSILTLDGDTLVSLTWNQFSEWHRHDCKENSDPQLSKLGKVDCNGVQCDTRSKLVTYGIRR